MKAITAVCATGASVPAVANGRVSRPQINRHHNNSLRDTNSGENAEIQMYLSKLKDLVPFMPKNKKLSKLDVILNVIDYICDLQSALESHPAVNTFDAQAVLNGIQQQQQHQQSQQHQQQIPQNQLHLNNNNLRQPLGVRSSPNQIINHNLNSQQQYSISNNNNNLSSQHHYNHHESYVNHNSEYSTHQSHVTSDKITTSTHMTDRS